MMYHADVMKMYFLRKKYFSINYLFFQHNRKQQAVNIIQQEKMIT